MPTVLFLAVALLAVGGLQAQSTTGRIIGTVTDLSGQGLHGATVTISSDEADRWAKDRERRRRQFPVHQPPPGRVHSQNSSRTVSSVRSGRRSGSHLEELLALFIAMPQARFESEIEVVAESPVADPTRVNTEQVFNLNYMQQAAVGSENRNYLYIVGQASGSNRHKQSRTYWARPCPKMPTSSMGRTLPTLSPEPGEPSTTTTRLPRSKLRPPDSRQNTGEPQAGRINVLTKSGGNQFSGTLDIRYRGDSFQESGDHYDYRTLETSSRGHRGNFRWADRFVHKSVVLCRLPAHQLETDSGRFAHYTRL